MASVPLSKSAVASLKKALRNDFPDIRSSHLSEALAAALGQKSHAALLAVIEQQNNHPLSELLDDKRFNARLQELGYKPDPEFSFELMDSPELISTSPISGYEIEYKSLRDQAWRNLMVCAINAAIRQNLFSLRPSDNRWPGWGPSNEYKSPNGVLFDFMLPSGQQGRGYVHDISYGELSIHAAVNPKGDWVRASNAGFHAGDAFACGWLERKTGAWLQSSNSMFSCRKSLVQSLAEMNVQPLGFGDRGKVIM